MKYKLIDGKVVPADGLLDWAQWFENSTNRIIEQTIITPSVNVSTVFLGIDHNFVRDNDPILF